MNFPVIKQLSIISGVLILLTYPLNAEDDYLRNYYIPAEKRNLIQTLQQEASNRKLYKDPAFIKLLYYKPVFSGGFKSQADGSDFFLSAEGKHNPEKEMNALIESLFREDPKSNSYFDESKMNQNTHPVCRFPARTRWIIDKLEIPEDQIANPLCTNYINYRKRLKIRSISLVFASYFVNEPASAFGHTLLKLNSANASSDGLLDMAVNFAAEPGFTDPFTYAIGGLTGLFPGRFSLMPYHIKVMEYNGYDSRDLLEYELNLNDSELNLILDALWELSNTYFDYYFTNENCSYHLLSLLETVRPDLNLTDRFFFWVMPAETVRATTETENLIISRKTRPSAVTVLLRKFDNFSPDQASLFRSLRKAGSAAEASEIFHENSASDIQEKLQVLDTLLETYRFKSDRKIITESENKVYKRLLILRAGLGPSEYSLPEINDISFTEQSHLPSSFRPGLGVFNGDLFLSVSFRPFLHDFYNFPKAYAETSHVAWFDTEIRWYNGNHQPELHNFNFLHIEARSPVTLLTDPLSFSISTGLTTVAETEMKSVYFPGQFQILPLDFLVRESVERKLKFFADLKGGKTYGKVSLNNSSTILFTGMAGFRAEGNRLYAGGLLASIWGNEKVRSGTEIEIYSDGKEAPLVKGRIILSFISGKNQELRFRTEVTSLYKEFTGEYIYFF